MVYRRKYPVRRRRYAKKVKGAKRLSKPLRRAMTQVAKKVISRRAEDKMVGAYVEQDVFHNSAIGSADCEPVMWQISQGTDSRNRLGDRITPKSIRVKGVLSLNHVTPPTGTADIYARVLILSQKDIKSGAEVLSNGVDTDILLKAGFGSSALEIPFSGNTGELMIPVNTDKFRVYYDRIFKFSQFGDNGVENLPKYSHMWSYTFTKKNLPATLTYDESSGDWANNFCPFVAIGYAYSDGTAPDTVGTKLISNILTQVRFEDL